MKTLQVCLVVVDEESMVLFNLLIDLFCLTISLGVVCHRGIHFDSRELVEFITEQELVLTALITYELARLPMESEDMVSKEGGHTLCSAGGVWRDDVDLFREAVNEYCNCIIAWELWECTNHVSWYHMLRVWWGFIGVKRCLWHVLLRFGLLTLITSCYISVNVGCDLWLKVVLSDEFPCALLSWVSCYNCVIMHLNDIFL